MDVSTDKLSYDAVLDLAVCSAEKCGFAMAIENVKSHIRRTHHNNVSSYQKLIEDRIRSAQRNGDRDAHRELRMKYFESSIPEVKNSAALPAVESLPVLDCMKCPSCGYIAPKEETVRRHMKIMPCSELKEEHPIPVRGQSLFGGNRIKYFEVIDSRHPRRGTCRISEVMRKIEGCKPSNVEGLDVSRMDSFLSRMRFDLHLQHVGLSMEDSFNLSVLSNAERDGHIRRLMSAYHKRSFDTCEKKVYIKSHRFLDADLSLAVSKETVEAYDGRMSRLLGFVFCCCVDRQELSKHFSAGTVETMRNLEPVVGTVSEETLSMLHSVLSTLLFDQVRDGEDGLMLFISCSSVFQGKDRRSYRFGSASDTSPMFAALKHLARCVVVREIYIREDVDAVDGWEWAQKATNGNMDSGIHFVQHCMRISNRVRSGETHKARFMVCPKHAICGIIDGHELSLDQLGENMRQLQSASWSVLENDILHGLEITDQFWTACSEMQDALTDRTTGYWFGTHSANHHHLEFWREALLTKVRPVLLNADGGVKNKEAKDFLEKCEELQGMLYVLLQSCSGAPARATEIGVVQVCNTAAACRNIFVSGGLLFMATFYHKCRNMQEGVGKPIVRYPDAVTAGLVIVYLFIVRPVESAIVHLLESEEENGDHVGAEEISTNHRDFLFVRRGRPLNGDRLRHWFEKGMKSVGISLGTNQYRQYHSGMVKNFLGGSDEDWDDRRNRDPSSLLHNQAGHTELTAHNVYGVSPLDMQNLTGTEMEAFRCASKIWHTAIGLKHGQPCAADKDGLETTPVSESVTRSSGKSEHQELIGRLEKLEHTISSFMRLRGENHGTGCCKRDAVQANLESRFSSPKKKKMRPDGALSTDWKEEMRRFLGKEDVEFRSKEQEQGVNLAIRGEKDALVVLPTGGGKSLTFMLSAYVHPEKVVVVIVPLLALQQDLARRCADSGLQAVQWGNRDVAGSRIVITSAEHVSSRAYETFIREKSTTGKLHAIFIDEGHLIVLWQGFRKIMKDLHRYIRPINVQVPVITLTATAPPSISNQIGKACGMHEWEIVRQMTVRGNIRYAVRDVEEQTMLRKIDQALCERYTHYNTSSFRAIVYVPTRDDCDLLCLMLQALSPNIPCFKYHAGLEPEERKNMQKGWENHGDGKAHVMVATSAFGCGIDIPTVRGVIHAGSPKNLMEFIQESGRAGRDGNPAASIVFNTRGDAKTERPAIDRVPFLPDYDASREPSLKPEEWDERMFGTVESLRENSEECRRWVLDRFVDGTLPNESCQERMLEPCDICMSKPPSARDGILEVRENLEVRGNRKEPSYTFQETTRSSPTKSSSTSATAEEVMKYALAADKSFCPPCTVVKRKETHHVAEEKHRWSCYRGRCLRCATKGHDAKNCTMFRIQGNNNGCYTCTMSTIDGIVIHEGNEYGRKSCRYSKILNLATLGWQDKELRERMKRDLPGVRNLHTLSDLQDWLVGKGQHPESGLKNFVPWFFDTVLVS